MLDAVVVRRVSWLVWYFGTCHVDVVVGMLGVGVPVRGSDISTLKKIHDRFSNCKNRFIFVISFANRLFHGALQHNHIYLCIYIYVGINTSLTRLSRPATPARSYTNIFITVENRCICAEKRGT